MPFPPIYHGLICEELRSEQRNLITLLGFYGVMPYVELAVQNFTGPVRLAFLLVGGPGSGSFNVSVRLVAPDGVPLSTPPSFPWNIDSTKPRSNLGFGMIGMVLPQAGMYTFELLVEGEGRPVYTNNFTVRLAQPGELPPA